MTITELQEQQRILDSKIAVLIKEFEDKCKGIIIDSLNIERFNSFTPGNDAVIVTSDCKTVKGQK